MKRILAAVALLALTACASTSSTNDLGKETRNMSAQEIYQQGMSELNDGSYEKAVKYFETVEARYPYGVLAEQSQLETAYAWYKDGETASAIAAADRFIKLHPDNPHVDYAWYLKGLANFNDGSGFMSRISHQDLSERDPKAATDSFMAFRELVTRYPHSRYAPDATARMRYLVDTLAAYDLHVARYYVRRKAWVAAAGRARYVIENYPKSNGVEEALAILVKAYGAMGLNDLKNGSLRVLRQNFPHSVYLAGNNGVTLTPNKSPWWKPW